MITKKLFLLTLFLSSCALHTGNKEVIKNKDDMVSVGAAVDLARSSYVKGCVDKAKERGQSGSFSDCTKKSKQYIKKNVLFILNQ